MCKPSRAVPRDSHGTCRSDILWNRLTWLRRRLWLGEEEKLRLQRSSSGGGSVKKTRSGGGSVKQRTSGGGLVKNRSYNGGSVKKRRSGGGSVIIYGMQW
ncbi:hypothetical protein IGI04_023804 [Brassica rapa subsp. trilocularis]|uniref:Uncharacterized protein n=1 Tax=Brassica rapa subsp. trilocularis TaxID=1813537 RepID=A0ABQ7M4X1_BRACM|nr:hypothetical protein IGI04_023804 [Brassica rapa subsp. trilocularis]